MAKLLEHYLSMMLEHDAPSTAERNGRNELTKMHLNLGIHSPVGSRAQGGRTK